MADKYLIASNDCKTGSSKTKAQALGIDLNNFEHELIFQNYLNKSTAKFSLALDVGFLKENEPKTHTINYEYDFVKKDGSHVLGNNKTKTAETSEGSDGIYWISITIGVISSTASATSISNYSKMHCTFKNITIDGKPVPDITIDYDFGLVIDGEITYDKINTILRDTSSTGWDALYRTKAILV